MQIVTSADGTKIACERSGEGSPVVMVAGAFNTRSATAPLAASLQAQFTVLNPDRRGRGDSGDTAPYAIEREIEDLAALVAAAGGSAAVFGYSSGAVLALEAAAQGLEITKLALYEPPYVDDTRPRPPVDLAEQLEQLLAADRRGDAVDFYQTQVIGIPADVVAQIRHAPFRPGLEAIAHTLVYDATIMGDFVLRAERIATITTPALVISGGDGPPFLHNAARALADTLPSGRLETLPGQTHHIDPDATAPTVAEFLAQ